MYGPYFSSCKPCWLCMERSEFVAAFSMCILEMELLNRLMSLLKKLPFFTVRKQSCSQWENSLYGGLKWESKTLRMYLRVMYQQRLNNSADRTAGDGSPSLTAQHIFRLVLAAVTGPRTGLCKDLGTLYLTACTQECVQLVEVHLPLVSAITLKSISLWMCWFK